MRTLIAFDKFKDALSASEACTLTARAIRESHPDWTFDLCPLTDGGDGFEEILRMATDGVHVPLRVSGPRGDLVDAGLTLLPIEKIPAAAYALLALPEMLKPTDHLAIIEMASASGLALLPPEQRDVWQTSSYGTGQLIRAAAEFGAAAILLGVGGSATHDLGLGALAALGLQFHFSPDEKLQPPVPALWSRLARINGEIDQAVPPLRIACDVTNPLLGPRGAASVFGPQKGLSRERFEELESLSAKVAALLCAHTRAPKALTELPGAGAAGGIAFGLLCAARAELRPGFGLIAAWLNLEGRIAAADMIITGEGRYDPSSSEGKGPGAVVARARAGKKPAHIFSGQIEAAVKPGVFLHEITPAGTPLRIALQQTSLNLERAVRTTFSGSHDAVFKQ